MPGSPTMPPGMGSPASATPASADAPLISARLALIAFVLFVVILGAAVLYGGPAPQTIFLHDVFHLYDSIGKAMEGSRPHADYYSPLGPLSCAFTALGAALAGLTPEAMPVGVVIGLAVVAALSWWIVSRRTGPVLCLAVCVLIAVYWCVPHAPRTRPSFYAYGMIYNRECDVVLALLALLVLLPRRGAAGNLGIDFAAQGALVAALLFWKISYFVAAAPLLLLALTYAENRRRMLAGWVVGGTIVGLPLLIYIRGDLLAMCGDFARAAAARDPDIALRNLWVVAVDGPLFALPVLITLARLLRAPLAWSPGDRRRRMAEFIAMGASMGLALAGNWPFGFPYGNLLWSVYGLTLLTHLAPLATRPRDVAFWRVGLIASGAPALVLLLGGVNSIGGLVDWRRRDSPPFEHGSFLHAPGWERWEFVGAAGYYPAGVTYADKINDGLELLRRHADLFPARIGALDFTNPFPALLGQPYPPAMPSSLHAGVSISATQYPPAAQVFRQCDVLMIPRYPDDPAATTEILRAAYASFLQEHFRQIDESEHWMLFRRIPGGTK